MFVMASRSVPALPSSRVLVTTGLGVQVVTACERVPELSLNVLSLLVYSALMVCGESVWFSAFVWQVAFPDVSSAWALQIVTGVTLALSVEVNLTVPWGGRVSEGLE